MVISTQVSLDSSNNSLDLSSKNSNSLSNNIADKNLRKINSVVDKSKSNSKSSDKTNDFKKIIDSKIDNKNYSNNNSIQDFSKKDVNNSNQEVKEKIESLKEEIKDNVDDEEKVNNFIESLLSILNNLLGVTKNDENPEINNIDTFIEASSEILDTSSLLSKMLEAIGSEDVKSNLDTEVLSSLKDLLSDFVSQLSEDIKVKDGVKDNISDILSKLTDMIDESKNNNGKVLSLEEMLNNSHSKQQGESSLADTDSQKSEMIKSSKQDSKEDKFLNSLLDDKNDNSIDNKINMFASRTQHVQGQNTENRGLSLNKVTFTNDVIKDVKYMVTNSIRELSVKVNPGNLGEITIKMIQEDGLMKANLKANSKETTALLLQNISEIKKELAEQNMKISEVNIELYNDDTTYFKNGSFGGTFSEGHGQHKNKTGSSNVSTGTMNIEQDEEVIENNAKIDNTLDFLA